MSSMVSRSRVSSSSATSCACATSSQGQQKRMLKVSGFPVRSCSKPTRSCACAHPGAISLHRQCTRAAAARGHPQRWNACTETLPCFRLSDFVPEVTAQATQDFPTPTRMRRRSRHAWTCFHPFQLPAANRAATATTAASAASSHRNITNPVRTRGGVIDHGLPDVPTDLHRASDASDASASRPINTKRGGRTCQTSARRLNETRCRRKVQCRSPGAAWQTPPTQTADQHAAPRFSAGSTWKPDSASGTRPCTLCTVTKRFCSRLSWFMFVACQRAAEYEVRPAPAARASAPCAMSTRN